MFVSRAEGIARTLPYRIRKNPTKEAIEEWLNKLRRFFRLMQVILIGWSTIGSWFIFMTNGWKFDSSVTGSLTGSIGVIIILQVCVTQFSVSGEEVMRELDKRKN